MKATLFAIAMLFELGQAVEIGDNKPLTSEFPTDCSSEQTCSDKCCSFDDG